MTVTKAKVIDVHKYVGKKIKELRGSTSHIDFEKRYGVHALTVQHAEDGAPLCLYTVQYLADKTGKDVAYFFPNGEIPKDYPEH